MNVPIPRPWIYVFGVLTLIAAFGIVVARIRSRCDENWDRWGICEGCSDLTDGTISYGRGGSSEEVFCCKKCERGAPSKMWVPKGDELRFLQIASHMPLGSRLLMQAGLLGVVAAIIAFGRYRWALLKPMETGPMALLCGPSYLVAQFLFPPASWIPMLVVFAVVCYAWGTAEPPPPAPGLKAPNMTIWGEP